MHRYVKLFGKGKGPGWNRKTLIVVLHLSPADTYRTAYRETAMAKREGADGVFIIDMHGNLEGDAIVSLTDNIATAFPNFFVGVNDLSAFDPSETIYRVAETNIKGIWSDRVGHREIIEQARATTGWDGLLYTGVIFKHQPDFWATDEEIDGYVKAALPYVDVPTTSGQTTGVPADINRLRLVREAAGPEAIIALASGATAENVSPRLEFIDSVLAASSLVDKHDRLVPIPLRAMRKEIHGYSA